MGKYRNSGPSKSGKGEELHAAARSGDLRAVQTMLAANPLTINSRDKHSRTPLHLAAWAGQSQVVTYLCQQKADVGAAAMDDMGAIHFASQKGHVEIVKTLLSSGVSVKSTNRKGFTPLHYAAQGSHLELVTYLAKKGASLSTETKAGKTPLDLASSEEIRSFLIEWEKSPNKREEILNAENKAEGSDIKKSEVSDEVEAGEISNEDESLKRKGDGEEPKEASLPKKPKVTLSHLVDDDDAQDAEE